MLCSRRSSFEMGKRTVNTHLYDLLVTGAEPSGLTAGTCGHPTGLNVLMIGGYAPDGKVTLHYKVANYPEFRGGITGAFSNRMGHDVNDDVFRAKAVIVTVGSKPRRLEVPGDSKLEGKVVFYYTAYDAPLLRTVSSRRPAVIGSGDTAFHTAVALLPHAELVTVIRRGSEPRAKPVLIQRLLQNQKASILVQRSVIEIIGEQGFTCLSLQHTETKDFETFGVDAVFVGVGQSPVTRFLNGKLVDRDRVHHYRCSTQHFNPRSFCCGRRKGYSVASVPDWSGRWRFGSSNCGGLLEHASPQTPVAA